MSAAPASHPNPPTLGLSHLPFEASLSAARSSSNPNDVALVTMLGLRNFEVTSADVDDLGEKLGHRSYASSARAPGSC